MAPVAAVFCYEIPAEGLWVDEGLLGQEFYSNHRGFAVRRRFPSDRKDFGLEQADDVDALSGGYSSNKDGETSVGVAVVQVTVYADAPFGSADFPPGEPWPHQDAGFALISELERTAQTLVSSLLGYLRTHKGQHWLGSATDQPRRVWLSHFIDTESGDRIPLGAGGAMTAIHIGLERRLMSDDIEQALAAIVAGLEPLLPEELIAEAKFLAWVRQPKDLRMAALLGAIACEAKIKSVLSAASTPTTSRLLDLILDNPRDVSLAVITHLDRTSSALLGRSLRSEDKDLWKRANELFEIRNKIAHGKHAQPEDEQLGRAVRSAAEVFDWIDSLRDAAK